MVKKQKIVIGVDEAGRGPLAGPVVAAAVALRVGKGKNTAGLLRPNPPSADGLAITKTSQCLDLRNLNIGIRDSKKMTAKQREGVFQFLKNESAKDISEIVWAVGRVGERVIDKINILEASKLAMKRAVLNLEKKLGQKANLLLIDGNFAIPLSRNQRSIVKGDEKVPLISLASIIAKVSRDRLMQNYHKKYPQYGFQQHKGYPTKEHKIRLANCGPCKIHRYSFRPVAELPQKGHSERVK